MTPALLLAALAAQNQVSGGALRLEQAVHGVHAYDVGIRVDPAIKTRSGTTNMDAKGVIPTAMILSLAPGLGHTLVGASSHTLAFLGGVDQSLEHLAKHDAVKWHDHVPI